MRTAARLTLLAGLTAAGVAIGVFVESATGAQAGFLALPALLAAGWVLVADPTRCRRKGP